MTLKNEGKWTIQAGELVVKNQEGKVLSLREHLATTKDQHPDDSDDDTLPDLEYETGSSKEKGFRTVLADSHHLPPWKRGARDA